MNSLIIILFYLLVINIAGFLSMGIDKSKEGLIEYRKLRSLHLQLQAAVSEVSQVCILLGTKQSTCTL